MSDLLNKASLVMVPSGYKEDTVYSVIPTDGSGDLTFTRASNGTRVNSAGLVEVCPWNLLTYSEDLSNGAWSPQGSSVTTNSTTAPNGTTTADTLIESNTTDEHNRFQTINISGQHTFSVYLKKYNVDWCALYVFNPSIGGIRYWINVNTLTAGTSANIGGGIGTTSLTLESVGNGWVRASILFNNPSGDCRFYIANAQSNGGATTYAGNGTSGVYVWGAQVNLGTLKPYFPTTDRLNVPRLTYQNGGGGCPSLLLEKQSTNLFTYSEDFTQWLNAGGTVNGNTTISPDGTQNADTLTGARYQTALGTAVFTFSCYAKKVDGNNKFVLRFDVPTTVFAQFDLNTGTIDSTSSGYTSTITNVGNGWYRCTITSNSSIIISNAVIVSANSGSNSTYIWGAQLEASSYPTSYIPTTSSSATRVADACYKTGISSLIGQTQGTIFVDYTATSSNQDGRAITINDYPNTAYNNRIAVINNGNQIRVFISSGGVLQYDGYFGAWIGHHKVAIAYASNDLKIYIDGVEVASQSSSFTPPTCSVLSVGTFENNTSDYPIQGNVNQAILFKTRLTNAELASLTTI